MASFINTINTNTFTTANTKWLFLILVCLTSQFAHATTTKSNTPEFIIGNLLPDARSLMFINSNMSNAFSAIDKQTCPSKLASVLYAIVFASEKLSQMFLELYKCNFNLNPANTNCDVAYGTRSFFELAKDIRRTLIVFSGSCESTIKPIAESVQFFNLTLLSYTETDPTFSDQTKYNGFYRMVPSEEQHNGLRIHTIKQYNWTRIGTIYQTQAKYTLAHNQLIREIDKTVNITSRTIFDNLTSNQYEEILNQFKEQDIKIIVGIFDMSTTVRLFCEIFKKNMYGENYQWIILGGYNQELALLSRSSVPPSHLNVDCTVEQLLTALNGTLQTRVVQYSYHYEDLVMSDETALQTPHQTKHKNISARLHDDKPSIDLSKQAQLDKKYSDLVDLYIEQFTDTFDRHHHHHHHHQSPSKCLYSYFHGYAFDALLAVFKVFSTAIENRKFSCSNPGFRRSIEWFTLVNSIFKKISFKGVTGNVSFSNGSRIGQTKLEQLLVTYTDDLTHENGRRLELKESLIYVHDQNDNKFYGFNKIKWHGKNPPRDQTIRIETFLKIPRGIFIGMSLLASTGVILALIFLIFNIKFRQHRFIKMSSPYLNNLIIIGCLFSYTSIYFLGEYDNHLNANLLNSICVIRVWLLTIGFTLAFGAMFSKTYRVHAILTNSKLTKKVIKDYKLYGIVVFLLVIDVIILLFWQIFDPLHIERRDYQKNIEGEKMVVVFTHVCESSYMKLWIGSLFSFKSLLILFGCFFAYETRHVSISALNDSQYIGISVYNVLIMCSAGAAIAFIVHDKISSFILISLFIFACTTITLCLVFLPKIIEVKKDPTGKKKPKPKNNFKKVVKNESIPRFNDINELDRKINCLVEDNKNKSCLLEQISLKIENLLRRAQTLGVTYYEECVKHMSAHCEDGDIKKIVERFKVLSQGGEVILAETDEVIVTAVSLPVKTNATTTSQPIIENAEDGDENEEDDDDEKFDDVDEEGEYDDAESGGENESFIQASDTYPDLLLAKLDNGQDKPLAIEEIEHNIVLMNNDDQPPTILNRYAKRTFNPPPKIVDLNNLELPTPATVTSSTTDIIDNTVDSAGNYTFKMDI